MKVGNNIAPNPQLIEKAKNSERSNETSGPASKAGMDPAQSLGGRGGATVEISDRAKLMKQATDVVKSSPDVRKEKVQALKKSIQDGTYRVDSSAIAERLVDEHLGSDFGKNNL